MEEFKTMLLLYLPKVGVTVLIIGLGLLLTWLLSKIFGKAMNRRNVDKSLVGFLDKCLKITCLAIIVIAALSQLGVSTTGLIAFFSAALAAVALALKDSISDIASGIIILFTRPFVTGDFIEFGQYRGYVQKIDIIHTVILTYDDTNIIIPNSKITASEVNNFTEHPIYRVTVMVPIPYDADIDKVKKILFDTMNAADNILTDAKHTPVVRLEKYGDSTLEFSARCWCDWKDYWSIYYSLTENIKKSLDKNNIAIPFNQLDVHLVNHNEKP